MEPVLEIRDLAVRFDTFEGCVHAVNGVTYSVYPGKTLGVVGESGCGKSVTVLTVMRLIQIPPGRVIKGEICYEGVNLLELDINNMQDIRGKDIAMIFQDPMTSFNPVLTIGRQISEAMTLHLGMDKTRALQRAGELLELVGIPEPWERLNDYPHQLSGGMRQRAMIAMALSCNPRLLIADEPTTALDVTIQAQIIELVKRLQDELGMAVIWITHDLGVIAEIADRVVVMYAGYVVEEADVFTVFGNPLHPYTKSLLKSLPRVDKRTADKLAVIKGQPPDCLDMPPSCPFTPRCDFAFDHCFQENPPLVEVGDGHLLACWYDITTGRER